MTSNRLIDNKFAIGMHMHGFNRPPMYELGDYLGKKGHTFEKICSFYRTPFNHVLHRIEGKNSSYMKHT